MGLINHNWLNAQETRRYPLDDNATGTGDNGVRMKDDVIVDLHLRWPKLAGQYAFLSGLTVTKNIVTAVFLAADSTTSASGFTPLASITVQQPATEYSYYTLNPLYPGVGGFIAFGAIEEPFSIRFSTPQQGLISPKTGRPYDLLPIPSMRKLNRTDGLVGLVKILAGADIEIVKETVNVADVDIEALVIRLQAPTSTRNILADYIGPCGIRPESGNCDRPGIQSINDVPPDCNGNLEIEFKDLIVANYESCGSGGAGLTIQQSLGLNDVCVANGPNQFTGTDYCTSLSSSLSHGSADSSSAVPPHSSNSASESHSSASVPCTDLPFLDCFAGSVNASWEIPQGLYQLVTASSPDDPCGIIPNSVASDSSLSSEPLMGLEHLERTIRFGVRMGDHASLSSSFISNPGLYYIENSIIDYTQSAPPQQLTSHVVIGDDNSPTLVSATIKLHPQYVEGQDVLLFNNSLIPGITGSWDVTTGTLTLTGTASLLAYQHALRAVYYQNTAADPTVLVGTTNIRRFDFTVNDGTNTSDVASRYLTITSPISNMESGTYIYSTNQGPYVITDTLELAPTYDDVISSATVDITATYIEGADLLVCIGTSSISSSFNVSTGLLTLSGVDTVANYQAILRTVTYSTTALHPFRVLLFRFAINGTTQPVLCGYRYFYVYGTPVIYLPSPLTAVGYIRTAIDGLHFRDDNVSDGVEHLKLHVSHGVLHFSSGILDGVTTDEIAGNGTNNITIHSILLKINASLAVNGCLTYTSRIAEGSDTLAVKITDTAGADTGTLTAAADLPITIHSNEKSLQLYDTSRRNVMIWADCGTGVSTNKRVTTQVQLTNIGIQQNAGVILNYHLVNPITHPLIQYFVAQINRNTNRVELYRYNGASLVLENFITPAIPFSLVDWYQIQVTALPDIPSGGVTISVVVTNVSTPGWPAVSFTLLTNTWGAADGKFGVHTNQAVANFSFWRLEDV